LELKKKKDLLKYAMDLFELIDSEYSHLYGTVPLSDKQKKAYIDQYFGFVSLDLVPIILDQNNKMVAFAIVMPSLTKALQKSQGNLFPFGWFHLLRALKSNTQGDLYLIAVKSDYRRLGVNAAVMYRVNLALNKHGISTVESNANLEDNINVQAQWKYFEHRQHKRRRCVIKHINKTEPTS
jgi:ribosomal protein S18 acetylase RimI-like enzyme